MSQLLMTYALSEFARCSTAPDYQVEEVQNAVKELKLMKTVNLAKLTVFDIGVGA